MFRKNIWAWWLGAVIILIAALAASFKQVPIGGIGTNKFAEQKRVATVPDVVAQNAPVVEGFVGDLEDGGNKENDDNVIPFVIGDFLKLEANALNATEYRWTVDGKAVLTEDGQEWSVKKDREWEVKEAGEHTFAVQVRGTDPKIVSQPREKTLKTEKLIIKDFAPNMTQDEERALTGTDYQVEVTMAEPLSTEVEYRYRYSVNDEIVKNPEDGEEWSDQTDFTYTFPAPGKYSFKVEVRRSTEKDAEVSKVMAQTIEVGDAVLLSFDVDPEKQAALGAKIDLSVFPQSLLGKSECRFGVRKVDTAKDFDWLSEDDGAIWGDDKREWQPVEPGLYMLRAEVREAGKEQADDYRELRYQISEGGF